MAPDPAQRSVGTAESRRRSHRLAAVTGERQTSLAVTVEKKARSKGHSLNRYIL